MHGAARLTPELLLTAYAQGVFPMAERRDDPNLFWVSPETRGDHSARRLPRFPSPCAHRAQRPLRSPHRYSLSRMSCAPARRRRPAARKAGSTPRSSPSTRRSIERGHAHSVECWRDGQLVGGLYGVNLGSAFFGESMFMRERDASKVALVHLVARLIKGGFTLLDAQFLTDHLARFGAIAIPRAAYHEIAGGGADERCRVLLSRTFRQIGQLLFGACFRRHDLDRRGRRNRRRHLARLVRLAADHPDVVERMIKRIAATAWTPASSLRTRACAGASGR